MLSMAMKWAVRRVAGCPRAKLVPFLSILVLCTVPVLHAQQITQQKTETPQQTNEKIQELAAKNHLKPHDVPGGYRRLIAH